MLRWKASFVELIKGPKITQNTVEFRKDCKLHNIDFPALIEYYPVYPVYPIYPIHSVHQTTRLSSVNKKVNTVNPNVTRIVKCIMYCIDGKSDRGTYNKPATLHYWYNGNIKLLRHYWQGQLCRPIKDGPICREFNYDGSIYSEMYHVSPDINKKYTLYYAMDKVICKIIS